jgi:putative spermidine/putrescine transport system substrate-binding protein
VRFCSDPKRQSVITEVLAYGPTNLKAYDHIPAKRASLLPTAPGNLKGMFMPNHGWWQQNRADAIERFNAWILK